MSRHYPPRAAPDRGRQHPSADRRRAAPRARRGGARLLPHGRGVRHVGRAPAGSHRAPRPSRRAKRPSPSWASRPGRSPAWPAPAGWSAHSAARRACAWGSAPIRRRSWRRRSLRRSPGSWPRWPSWASANSLIDVALNVQGVELERRCARPLLSGLHSAHSFGVVAGGVGGTLCAARAVPLIAHFAAVAGIALRRVPAAHRRAGERAPRARRRRRIAPAAPRRR